MAPFHFLSPAVLQPLCSMGDPRTDQLRLSQQIVDMPTQSQNV
ncbi:MAG: hypothetical protein AAF633_17315 [Chloroflexota bacterium]